MWQELLLIVRNHIINVAVLDANRNYRDEKSAVLILKSNFSQGLCQHLVKRIDLIHGSRIYDKKTSDVDIK